MMKVVRSARRRCQIPKASAAAATAISIAALLAPASSYAADIIPSEGAPKIAVRQRPSLPASHPWACSDRVPVCVHAASDETAGDILPALHDLEDAALRLHHAMRWPAPLGDGHLGGTAGFDVYLQSEGEPYYEVVPDDANVWAEVDRTSAFALVQPGLPNGCLRAHVLAEAYARAGLHAVDTAADEGSANGTAAFVASQMVQCPIAWLDAVDDTQGSPNLAITNTSLHGGRGGMLFPWFLQDTRAVLGTIDFLHAVWAMSGQRTKSSEPRWLDDPNFLRVLARLQDGRTASIDGLLLEYAIARAFVGERDDGLHLPDTAYLGTAGRVRFEWSLPWSETPRSVGNLRPIEPTGSAYIWIDLADAPKNAGLMVQARWEIPTQFRLSFLRIGTDGSPLTRVDPPTLQRVPEMQVTLDNLSGAAGLLIVLCNTGPVPKDFAFDPHSTPYMPSGYIVSLFPHN